MNCQVQSGVVKTIADYKQRQELTVLVGQKLTKAINFPALTGRCKVEDQVILNTTAVALQLGTGGEHFVMAIVDRDVEFAGAGHIMKVRYTPSQGRVLSVEEPASPYHTVMQQAETIAGLPVIVGSLHSMLGPVCLAFNQIAPAKKLVYLMSDGAALPIGLSRLVECLQDRGLVSDTITFGHAFGGDLEAVNIFSALLAAKHVCKADAAVVLMGPGIVGTNTTWGTTAVEQGVFLNAVQTLGGLPIGLLRVSFAEGRSRHQGISHHSLTSLTNITECSCSLPLPKALQAEPIIQEQLALLSQHEVKYMDTALYEYLLNTPDIPLKSMGRTPTDDPHFFGTALASGMLAAGS